MTGLLRVNIHLGPVHDHGHPPAAPTVSQPSSGPAILPWLVLLLNVHGRMTTYGAVVGGPSMYWHKMVVSVGGCQWHAVTAAGCPLKAGNQVWTSKSCAVLPRRSMSYPRTSQWRRACSFDRCQAVSRDEVGKSALCPRCG